MWVGFVLRCGQQPVTLTHWASQERIALGDEGQPDRTFLSARCEGRREAGKPEAAAH